MREIVFGGVSAKDNVNSELGMCYSELFILQERCDATPIFNDYFNNLTTSSVEKMILSNFFFG
jgi:hypothetical protein